MAVVISADDQARAKDALSGMPSDVSGRRSVSGLFSCGVVSGMVTAGLLNPYDRALYLSVKNRRPFFDRQNWSSPYRGFTQTLFQRAVSTGLYFPLEQLAIGPARHVLGLDSTAELAAGMAAGACNGVLLNPLSAIKYNLWGTDERARSFITTASSMWRKGGLRPLMNGMGATISRDLVFGAVYAPLRHGLYRLHAASAAEGSPSTFASNMVAAGLATVLSSPLNFVRNVQYATRPSAHQSSAFAILSSLWRDARAQRDGANALTLVQERLRIGWGTMRVAVGMGLSAQLYDTCTRYRNTG